MQTADVAGLVRLAPAHGGERHDAGLLDRAGELLAGYGPLVLLGAVAVGYVVLFLRARRRRSWPVGRPVAFVVGLALMTTALSPPVDSWADADFGGHMVQHLLLGMVGPVGLVLGAPVTLLLCELPHRHARRLGRLLNTGAVHHLTQPVVALALSSGGLVLLYFTPVYELSTRHDGVHLLVHLHLALAGILFAWVIAGPDPGPRRASVRTRLVVLGISIAVHASASQLLYAGLLVQVHEPVEQMRAAGSLMYFGGDIAELLLALAMLVTWRQPAANARARRGGEPNPWHRAPAGRVVQQQANHTITGRAKVLS